MGARKVVKYLLNNPPTKNNVQTKINWNMEEKENIASEAMLFVKENCLSWCNLEFCHLRACEKPELKQQIINSQKELIIKNQ